MPPGIQLGEGGKKAGWLGELGSDAVQREASADPREHRSEMAQERSAWGLSPGFLPPTPLLAPTSTPTSPGCVAVEGRAVALLLHERGLLERWGQELWGHCDAPPRCALPSLEELATLAS